MTDIHRSKEPADLFLSDGKLPDGLSLIPWPEGKSLTRNVTVADTHAATHHTSASATADNVAEEAAFKKDSKYV